MPLTFDKAGPAPQRAAGTTSALTTAFAGLAATPTALEALIKQHVDMLAQTIAQELMDRQKSFEERYNKANADLKEFQDQYKINQDKLATLQHRQKTLEEDGTHEQEFVEEYHDNQAQQLALLQEQRELKADCEIQLQLLRDFKTLLKSTQTRETQLIFIAQQLQDTDHVAKLRTEIQAETKLPADATRDETNALLQRILEQCYQTLTELRLSDPLEPASQKDQPTHQLLIDIGNLPAITIAALRQMVLNAIEKHELLYHELDLQLHTSLGKHNGQSSYLRSSPQEFEEEKAPIEKKRQQSQQAWHDLLRLLPMDRETCAQLLRNKKQHLIIPRLEQLGMFNEHTPRDHIAKITMLLKIMAENRELLTSPTLRRYFDAIQDALVQPKDIFDITQILQRASELKQQLTVLLPMQQQSAIIRQMKELCDTLEEISPTQLVADESDTPDPEEDAASTLDDTIDFSPTP